MKTANIIISKINNVEFDSDGEPLYSYEQLLEAMKSYAKHQCEKVRQDCADNAKAYSESRFPSIHYCECDPKVDKQSILQTPIELT